MPQGVRIPVFISGTIVDNSGRTLSGQTNEAFWNSVAHAKPMAVGLNCALGASDMHQYVANLSKCADCFVFCYPNAGLPNAMGGYDQKGPEMAEEIRPFFEDGLLNAVGGCCGTGPEHIAAIRAMAEAYPPRKCATVEPLMRLSGLEPLTYEPDAANMRRTFLNIGERCNVAGSSIYKKAIVAGDFDKALGIALQQVGAPPAGPACNLTSRQGGSWFGSLLSWIAQHAAWTEQCLPEALQSIRCPEILPCFFCCGLLV